MNTKTQNAFDILDEELRNQPDGKKFLKQLDIIYSEMLENRVGMDDICELAHVLTARECKLKKIKLDRKDKNEEFKYYPKAQVIFDYYYDQITNILGV